MSSRSTSRFLSPGPLRFAVPLLATLTAAACDREPPTASTPDDVNVLDLFLGDHRDEVGGALRFLSRDERREFERGRALFAVVFTPETGLGPLFNANGCATCHGIPAVGGVGPQIETHATAFSGGVCEGFDELNGGSVVQDSATPLLQAAGIFREPVLPQATETGRRITPDLFGFGLLEAVAEEEILRREDPTDRDHDGISGRANRDPDGNVTRFGRKGQVPDLEDFIVDAFIYEQGITSLDEPDEQLVGGQPLPPGVDPAPDPEISDEDIETVVTFVRLLAPPAPRRLSYTGEWGRRIFSQIGCASCHTPALRTGRSEIRALSNRVVFAYTDLLLHDMGPEMADMCNGGATPSEFRTEPLMGLRFHSIFLHDGRATSIAEAIAAHGGEASRARERYARLSHRQRDALLKFLSSL